MENMLQKIEDAVTKRLKENWLGVCEFDVGRGFESLLKLPAICVTTEKVELSEASGMLDRRRTLRPIVSVYALFKSVRPDARRAGIYPMVTALPVLLLGWKPDRDAEPFESAGPITEVFSIQLTSNKLVAFRIDVKTEFELEHIDGGEMTKLIMTANDYLYRDHESDTQEIEYAADDVAEKENEG